MAAIKKPKLYVDFDGVIFDTIATIVNMYNHDFKDVKGFREIKPEEITTWDFEELPFVDRNYVNRYFKESRFFSGQYGVLMRDVYIHLDKLSEIYEIVVVTMGDNENLRLKMEYVYSRFMPFIVSKFIGVSFDTHKDKSHIDMSDGIFVDDSILNLSTSNAKEKICFGKVYVWNKDWAGKRCYNWKELAEYLVEKKNDIYNWQNS